MIRFESDYLEGAHPRVLEKLAETNGEQTPGYGEDDYCRQARDRIRELCRRRRRPFTSSPAGPRPTAR